MPLFRKRPVVVEVRRYDPADGYYESQSVAAWCGGTITQDGCVIHTLEGDHLAQPGDWVIQGVHGEFYPCKPDIFEKTYEPA